METPKIIIGIEAQSITDSIIKLLQSQNSLAVQASGSDAIGQTISGIAKAKKILSNTNIHLNIKPVFPEVVPKDNPTTVIVFQITREPAFTKVDSSITTNKGV